VTRHQYLWINKGAARVERVARPVAPRHCLPRRRPVHCCPTLRLGQESAPGTFSRRASKNISTPLRASRPPIPPHLRRTTQIAWKLVGRAHQALESSCTKHEISRVLLLFYQEAGYHFLILLLFLNYHHGCFVSYI
jgi:hypothetical protein